MPDTSIQAYEEKTMDSIRADWDKIIKALKVIGSGHYEDIAKQMQVTDLNVVSRRLSEMIKKDLVVRSSEKKRTSRGRNAYIHTLANESQPKVEEKPAVSEKPPKKEEKERPTEWNGKPLSLF